MSSVRPMSLPAWLPLSMRAPSRWRKLGRWALLPGAALTLAGAWQGGWMGLGLATVGLLCAWFALHLIAPLANDHSAPKPNGSGLTDDAEANSDESDSTGGGMHTLVHDLTDEWSKQLSLGRDLNKEGLEKLLTTFANLSGLMGSMASRLANFKPTASAGAIGDAVDAQRPALDELMAPMMQAFEQREEMRAQVKVCADTLGSLLQWSKDARELAQHTRMVAFNASIEAVRGSGGSPDEMAARQTISGEIRRVSESIIALCDAMDKLMQPMHAASYAMQQSALIHDTNEEQLRLELELRARRAISAMFESLGGSLASGSELLEASADVVNQMEQAFTEFQFGDRVEQMLQILNQDINRLYEFSAKGQQPSAQDIKRWLNDLADSYTMDEQRSQHHNTELVDRSSRVEFF